jgi:HSP20 family protein
MMFDLFPRTALTDPLRDLQRLQHDVDRLFSAWPEGRSQDFPQLNLWAAEEGVIATVELPGIDPDSLQITVHKNTLTLSGEHPDRRPGGEAAALRRELPVGHFTRTVTLPFVVDAERVSARSEAGVLAIRLPRPETDRPKRVPIATA